jgi:hypothetical protein
MKSSVERRNACVAVSLGWSKIYCCIHVAQNRHEKTQKSELEINVTDSSAIRIAARFVKIKPEFGDSMPAPY